MALAHGADPNYRLTDKFRIRELLGTAGLAERYLQPLIKKHFPDRTPSEIRVLDVGTGQGMAVKVLRELGYDAYGLEPGGRYSDLVDGIQRYVFTCFSQDLPTLHPEVEKFDLIFSNGVVEHVGTSDGNSDLVADYMEYRRVFMESQIDLLRPRGILLVFGPNRLFPFDFQHNDHFYGWLRYLDRYRLTKYLTISWHPRNHLVSYNDLRKIVVESGRSVDFLYESQSGYSSMTKLRNMPVSQFIFRAYIGAVSIPPFPIRKFFETHTIFACRRR